MDNTQRKRNSEDMRPAQSPPGRQGRHNAQNKPGGPGALSSAEIMLVKKDLAAVWARKSQRALLMLLPIVLLVIIPGVYYAAVSLFPMEGGAQFPRALEAVLDRGRLEYRQGWMLAFTQLICPMLYLCVPVLTAAASASYAFVSEREEGTLETLLLTCVGARAVYHAKVTNCTVISVLISAGGFLAFALTSFIAGAFVDAPTFISWEWLGLLVFVSPVLSLFSVVFVALIVNRVHSAGESLQTMGYLIVPVAALYLMQLAGVLRVSFVMLLIVAAVLLVAAVVLFNWAGRNFTPEKLLAADPAERE